MYKTYKRSDLKKRKIYVKELVHNMISDDPQALVHAILFVFIHGSGIYGNDKTTITLQPITSNIR